MLNSFSDLTPGDFVLFDCRTTTPQKPKFALVGAVEADRAYVFLVNSELNGFITARPELLIQQISLPQDDYPEFLVRDSWLDGCEPHIVLEQDLSSMEIKSRGTAALLHQFVQMVEASKTVNRRARAAVAAALGTPR